MRNKGQASYGNARGFCGQPANMLGFTSASILIGNRRRRRYGSC